MDTLTTWPRRYTFHEWRQFPRNKNLPLKEAQELYRRESIKYTLLEQELLQLNAERQEAINSSISGLQAYVLSIVSGYNTILSAVPIGGRSATVLEIALDSPTEELMAENGLLLMTENFEHLVTG